MSADYEPSDGLLHIRVRPSDAVHEPALCGKRDQSSIPDAIGHYGPGGEGHKEVCPVCYERKHEKPVRS